MAKDGNLPVRSWGETLTWVVLSAEHGIDNSEMESASQRAFMHRTFIQFYLSKCCIKKKTKVAVILVYSVILV